MPRWFGYHKAMNRMPFGMVNKWRALSLKRLAFLSGLQNTGRWQLHYASQDAFDEALRSADVDAERWKDIAKAARPPLEAAE